MSQILNTLVVSGGLEIQHALENIMYNNIDGHTLSFVTYPFAKLDSIDRVPDLIFIDHAQDNVSQANVQGIIKQFPGCTYIVLDENPEPIRKSHIGVGVDEVMSLEALQSDVGKHLLEKLVLLKELAAAEARVEQSEERFRGIIEHSHDMIVLLDEEGTILYTSPAFGRQTGYEPWEVLGQMIFDFMPAAERENLKNQFTELLAGESPDGLSMEFSFKRQDGEWRNIEVMATNLLRNFTVQAVVLNARDVTRQKEAELELEKHRRNLESLVEQRTKEAEEANRRADAVLAASPDTLIAVDSNGFISFASQHYRVRYPSDAHAFMPGQYILEAFDVMARHIPLSPDDPRYEEMRNWWHSPQGVREFRVSGGTWVRLQAKRMGDGSTVVVSTTDITDYKRQQALLAAQSAELTDALETERQVVEQQKTFVSMVSHEFRTPLTIIDGNAQIIQKRGETLSKDMLSKRATTIRTAVERLVRLIETVLSTHMLDSGKLTIEPAACNLEKIIRDVAGDHQDISPSHKIIVDIKGLPKTMHLDEKVIRHILTNLMSNAVKYAPKNPTIGITAFEKDGNAVIQVTDEGVGIPENEIARIFTKYFRASTSSGIPGSGLGLSLAKQFVELHNGADRTGKQSRQRNDLYRTPANKFK
jgi:PAS domain S-box-containing protein